MRKLETLDDWYQMGRDAAGEALEEAKVNGENLAEAMDGLASDLLAEMTELDPNDPMYEYWCAECCGMLSRCD